LHMKMDEKIAYYFSTLVTLANQMKQCGDIMTNHVIIEKISRTLPSQFDHMVDTIKEAKRVKLKVSLKTSKRMMTSLILSRMEEIPL
jgi:hypothetical protein